MFVWNGVLWGVQIILGIKLLSVAFSHGLRQSGEKMRQGIQRIGTWSAYLLTGVAILSVLVALGLLLPAIASVPGWVAPVTAGLLAVMFLVSLVLHRQCRENANPIPMIVLFLMAVFVVFGRVWLAPL
jgi:hypothetical protein